MTNKSYKGDIGTVVKLDAGCSIADATTLEIRVKRPDGHERVWEATLEGTQILKYTVGAFDFDIDGIYYLQAYVVTAGGTWRGETVPITIYKHYK